MTENGWMNPVQATDVLTAFDQDAQDALKLFYSLGVILEKAHASPDFIIRSGLDRAFRLSDYGSDLLAEFGKASPISADEMLFLCLLRPFHRELTVDPVSINKDELLTWVDTNLTAGELLIPDRFGRTLYDRFHQAKWGDRLEFIEASEVDKLLTGTEPGVYQVGQITSGPLGILLSQQSRHLPPSSDVPLWHCADPGCGMIHSVRLMPRVTGPMRLANLFHSWLADTKGPPSEWTFAFRRALVGKPGRPFYDLIPLVADAICGEERTALLEAALTGDTGRELRLTISAHLGKSAASGDARSVASRISPNAQLQLVATLSDRTVIRIIDDLTNRGVIAIPQSEVRKTNLKVPKVHTRDIGCCLSVLGVRADRKQPARFLSSLVYNAYKKDGALPDLAWRTGSESPSVGSVFEFMRRDGPREALQKLVSSTRGVFNSVCEAVYLESSSLLTGQHTEDRLLWKLGFDVPRYDQKYGALRGALAKLREVTLTAASRPTESDKEKVRSAGVNAFIYVERFIEELVAYNAWLLAKDHFRETKFQYSYSAAVAAVSCVLNDFVPPKELGPWKVNGGNTLGTSLWYCRALVGWIEGCFELDKSDFVRKPADLPHFAEPHDPFFPFAHTALWADVDGSTLREFLTQFDAVVRNLEQSRVAEIRNGLGHYRDAAQFPGIDEVLACESRLTAALDAADVARLIPKAFWLQSKNTGAFGISECELVDYANRRVRIGTPQVMKGMIDPIYGVPYVLPFSSLLGNQSSQLCLQIKEESKYRDMWTDYPPARGVEASTVLAA